MDNVPDMHEESNILDPSPCVDEVYVSGEGTMLVGFDNGLFGSEYKLVDGDDNEDYESEDISDFEETIDAIENEHSDDDIDEIYVEKGIKGQPLEKEPNGKIKLANNQLFFNLDHFREILKDYAIQKGFQLYRVKNGRRRVTCECNTHGCTWRIHGSPTPEKIAKKLESLIVVDPNISYPAVKQTLLEKYSVESSSKMQFYQAKRKVQQTTKGVHDVYYNDLRPWIVLVENENKGSTVKLNVELVPKPNMNPQFKRLFLCLDAQKKRFVRGCRPWLGIDGCHLKGPYGGILLSIVALDTNRGIFPIAVGVVEIECKESWMFFLTYLPESLQSVPGVRSVLDKTVEYGRYCVVTDVGNDEYQVNDGGGYLDIDTPALKRMTSRPRKARKNVMLRDLQEHKRLGDQTLSSVPLVTNLHITPGLFKGLW
ncbi:hypothetical protein JHK87_050391 [Glycine soja]|nr:hypothetical protein JHK87_050391 [Glycine soja]